jgi:hypothetical protein
MPALARRAVDALAQCLEPDERDAVIGDFIELETSARRALLDITGLILRRQTALWKDGRSWIALTLLVIPLGLTFSLTARGISQGTAVYAWLYWDWWTPTMLTIPAARLELLHTVGGFLLEFATLAAWSWTCGAAMASLSNRTIHVSAMLFFFIVFAGTFGSMPSGGGGNPYNGPVFSLAFFRVVLPVIVKTIVVSLPALAGMQRGLSGVRMSAVWSLVVALGIVALTVRSMGTLDSAVAWSRWELGGRSLALRGAPPAALLPVVVVWPAVYLAALANWRRWRQRTSA